MQHTNRHFPSHSTPLGDRLLGWENDGSQPQQPGEGLWGRIEKDLPGPRRRRFVAWWVGGLLVAVSAAGIYFAPILPTASRQHLPAAGADAPCRDELTLPAFFSKTTPTAVRSGSGPTGLAADATGRQSPPVRKQAAPALNAPAAQSAALAIFSPDTLLTPDTQATAAIHTPDLHLVYEPVNTLDNTPHPLIGPTVSLDVRPWPQRQPGGSFYLSVHTALTDNHYVWQQTAPGNLTAVRSRQQLSWRNEWGGSIRYAYGRWSLSAGLSMYSGQLTSLSRYRRRFDPGQEQTTPEGNALSIYSLAIANPYGDADVNIEIQRNSTTSAPPQATLFFTVAATQQMRAWQLPLLLGYHIPLGKIHLGIYAGPAFEFHQLETLRASIQVSAPGQFVMRPVGRPRQQIASGVQLVSCSLALELSYPLSNDLRLYVRPFGQYSGSQLQSAQTNSYTRWGSQLGISYRIAPKR